MRRRQWILRLVIGCLFSGSACLALYAADRVVRATVQNAPDAPVLVESSTIKLTELYARAEGTLISGEGTQWSRANYAGTGARSQLFLEGQTIVKNTSDQTVEVLALTIMPLDPFHQPMAQTGGAMYSIYQVTESIAANATKMITWRTPVSSSNMFEVVALVTAVRFADGNAWTAPRDYIQGLFFE